MRLAQSVLNDLIIEQQVLRVHGFNATLTMLGLRR
jgi:hypothetical protein